MKVRQTPCPASLQSGPGRIALAIALALASQQVAAEVSMSSSPLLTAVSVSPNVFFVLDDSGSMQWERMPGDIMRNSGSGAGGNDHGYLFPLPAVNGSSLGTYSGSGTGNYGDDMPDFDDSTPDNVRYRSSQVNAIFYNPNVDYEPWVTNAGGTSLTGVPYFAGTGGGQIDPTAAPYNPARTGVGTLNLTIEHNLKAEWYGNASCSSDRKSVV